MRIDTVRICGLEDPTGFDVSNLSVSWKVREAQGKQANDVLLQLAKDADMQNVLWEKQGADLDASGEAVDLPLIPRTRYYVQVTVTSDAGETATSEPAFFETGKLEEVWSAEWIGGQEGLHSPEFRKMFSLEQPSENVAAARLYITGLGLFDASLNGQKTGNDRLAPFTSDYSDHVQYCTYDITGLLEDENEFLVTLGNGWYKGTFGLSMQAHPDKPYALLAELHITYRDGAEQVVITDDSWETRLSAFEENSFYDGETQNWLLTETEQWSAANITEAPTRVAERYSPTIRVQETLPVKEVLHTPAGETVLDFGQNFSGFVRVTANIPKGDTLKLEFGELLQDDNFYHENYRTAKSEFVYISDGEPRVIEPHFSTFGFRYVKVTGLESVKAEDFTGCVVYSDMNRTGFLETGHDKVNRLYQNALWGQKSNFMDMPTDCPQRDERLGWCGDAMVFSPTASFNMDTRAFYQKFLRDLRLDQTKNSGRVAIYLPNEFPGLYAGVWSDIATFLSRTVFEYYGNRAVLKENYPLMKDWVDFVDAEDATHHDGKKTHLYDFGFQFGDWLALDGATEQSRFGRTDNGYVASMYYYASTSYVADAAETLGLPEAAEYRERAAAIKEAIFDEYFSKNGRLAVETQTGYLLALKFGVYKDKQRILDALKGRLKQDCYRIKGGFVGATMMNTVLAENGMIDEAYDFLFFEGFPGWLYAVNLGATTIWERWNSVLPDGTISGVAMNSMNHYAYGSVMEFLYRDAAGIRPAAPGFRSAKIAPNPDIRLGHLNCTFDSVYGNYVSNWNINEDGSLSFHIEVPFGCEAEVCLPEQEPFAVDAGTYDYTIRTERNYRSLYKVTTRFETLLKDERAIAVLDECMPGFVDSIDRNDKEAMSRSLENELVQAALFRRPDEHIRKAIDGIAAIVA